METKININGRNYKAELIDKIDAAGNQYTIAITSRGTIYRMRRNEAGESVWYKV